MARTLIHHLVRGVAILTLTACGSDRLEYQGPNATTQDEPNTTPDQPDTPAPPEDPLMVDECPADATAVLDQEEIVVLGSGGAPTASAVLTASHTGWYDVYDRTIAESGPSQTNEAAYFRIANAANTSGIPRWQSCAGEWVVGDTDNDETPPAGSRIYIGTFWLVEGSNQLEMNHYCILYRLGLCQDLHDTTEPNSLCDSGPNSVHLSGSAFCLVERPM